MSREALGGKVAERSWEQVARGFQTQSSESWATTECPTVSELLFRSQEKGLSVLDDGAVCKLTYRGVVPIIHESEPA